LREVFSEVALGHEEFDRDEVAEAFGFFRVLVE